MGLSRANLQTIAVRTGRKVVAAWSDRDAGTMGTVVGVVMHHTGTPWGSSVAPTLQIVREGRPGLENALSTFYIDRAGTIYLISEKVCWHAGVGDWRGITDGNGHFLGIEAESDGVHWTAETVDSYVALVAEIVRFLGVDPAVWAIRHATWADPPGRKIDFAGLDEAAFRARVQARLDHQEDDVLNADDKKWMEATFGPKAQWSFELDERNGCGPARAKTWIQDTRVAVAGMQAALDKLIDAVAKGDSVTADELKQAVSEGIQDAGAALRATVDSADDAA